MAYADGELEGEELAEAKELLASDASAARFVEQIAGLGNVVARSHGQRLGERIASFDVADAVMAAVEKEANPSNVVSLSAARAKNDGSALKIGGGVVAALALAAAVFLYARPRETPMSQGGAGFGERSPAAAQSTVVAANASTDPASGQAGQAGPEGHGVSVSAVESPGHSVSVFYLPSANELSTSVVVWVDETSGEKK